MSNPIVEKLREQIGKQVTDSPSPVAIWLNGILRDINEGSITVDILVRKEMTNPFGTIHGGIIALIIDEVIGATVFTLNIPYASVSVNLNVDFLQSSKEGETITAKSKVIRRGRTIINVECSLFNPKGRLLAHGTSNLIKTNMKLDLI